jgi:hypothetical protein
MSKRGASDDTSGRKKLKEAEVATSTDGQSPLLRNEAELLVQSNLLRLQTEELIKEVKKDRSKLIDKAFEDVKSLLMKQAGYPTIVSEAYLSQNGLLGLHMDKYEASSSGGSNDEDCSLQFQSPAAVFISGGYALGACASLDITADVCVQIPSICFEDR